MTDRENVNRDVILDVIGREHQALTAAGQQVHTTIVWLFALSAVALTLCLGWVTIGSQLSLGGLTIAIPQASLLLVLAVLVMVLFWRVAALNAYGDQLRRTLTARYDSLGYTAHTDRTGFSGFMYPDLLIVLSALPPKLFGFLEQVLHERPLKRTVWRSIAFSCWLLTLLVVVALNGLLYVLPFLVELVVGWYAVQHRVNTGILLIYGAVLGLIYIASVWMLLLSFDRRETARALNGPIMALQEYAEYEQASKRAREAGAAAINADTPTAMPQTTATDP